jgi:hypothetical protein
LHLDLPQIHHHPVLEEQIGPARAVVTVVLQENPPFFLFLFGCIPIGVNQGFDVLKLGGIKGMDGKLGLREEVVENEMVFMSVRGDQIVYGSLILKLL